MKVIHYGSREFEAGRFNPIKNYGWIKPSGGLWTSPEGSGNGWKEWSKINMSRNYGRNDSFTLELKDEARIFKIDCYDDLHKAIKEKPSHHFIRERHGLSVLDFEKIAENYDAIWLTEKGERETRHSSPYNLYGWDCESILLFNTECFAGIRPSKMNSYVEDQVYLNADKFNW